MKKNYQPTLRRRYGTIIIQHAIIGSICGPITYYISRTIMEIYTTSGVEVGISLDFLSFVLMIAFGALLGTITLLDIAAILVLTGEVVRGNARWGEDDRLIPNAIEPIMRLHGGLAISLWDPEGYSMETEVALDNLVERTKDLCRWAMQHLDGDDAAQKIFIESYIAPFASEADNIEIGETEEKKIISYIELGHKCLDAMELHFEDVKEA